MLTNIHLCIGFNFDEVQIIWQVTHTLQDFTLWDGRVDNEHKNLRGR